VVSCSSTVANYFWLPYFSYYNYPWNQSVL